LKLKGPSLTRILFFLGAEGSVARFNDVCISRSLVYYLRQSLWTLRPSATTTSSRPLLWLASLTLSVPFFKSSQMLGLLGLPSPKSFIHIGQVFARFLSFVFTCKQTGLVMKRKTKGQFKHNTVILCRLRSTIGDSDFMMKYNYFRLVSAMLKMREHGCLNY